MLLVGTRLAPTALAVGVADRAMLGFDDGRKLGSIVGTIDDRRWEQTSARCSARRSETRTARSA